MPISAWIPVPLWHRFLWFKTWGRDFPGSKQRFSNAGRWRLPNLSVPKQPYGSLMEYLEVHIAHPLYPEVIALQVECSVTHLNRLCRAAFGMPLAAHIRRLRLDRAVHLLAHTENPVTLIAALVGIPDLQHFNKLIRRHTGKAPRELRRG